MLCILPLAGVFLPELALALLSLPRFMNWLLLYLLLSRLTLFIRELRHSLLCELPAEALNDLLVPLAMDLLTSTTALFFLIGAILGSPLSQLSFLKAR